MNTVLMNTVLMNTVLMNEAGLVWVILTDCRKVK
jgi:hypothetical protein